MRIGIEAQRIFRPKKHGMDIVALESIRALQEIDKENEYFIFVRPDEDRQVWKTSDNFHLIEVSAYSYLDWEQYQLPKIAKKYQLDLLHCTSNTAPIRLNMPLLITLHDVIYMEQLSFKGSFYQTLGNLYRRWNIPQTFKKAQRLITVSDFEKGQISKTLDIKATPIEVVYNAVGSQFQLYSESQKAVIKEAYHLPDSFIFFLGNKAPKKNMTNVLKAYAWYCKQVENPHPLIIAESSAEQIAKILESIGETKIMSKIRCLGYVPQVDMPFIYNLAQLFLYPSLRESFGIPILEAMACGTPVITAITSAMPEIAGEAAFLVNPYDYQSIGQGILKVLDSKDLKKKLIQSGLERAAQFSWKNTAKQLLTIYQNVN
jgi:glycosyltransferase involved in cell wall biosynthesis